MSKDDERFMQKTTLMLEFSQMALPETSKKKQSSSPSQNRTYPTRGGEPPVVVDPIWLLKAFLVAIATALACGYASLCFLLYQGQWQLILHPTRSSIVPAAIGDAPVHLVSFGTDASGLPQLRGWFVPAPAGARYANLTVLFLPSGDGSLVEAEPILGQLHELGLNLFAVDYRGYGQSAALHPNEERMQQDAETAFTYLTSSRTLQEKQIIVYGAGLGTSIAAHLMINHAIVPAVILDSPAQDTSRTVSQDARTRFLPVGLLLHERFTLAEPLANLRMPKLLIYNGEEPAAFRSASNPKMTVAVPEDQRTLSPQVLSRSLTRFLDQYADGVTAEKTLVAPRVAGGVERKDSDR